MSLSLDRCLGAGAMDSPAPLTDLRRRVNLARQTIRQALTELLGPVDISYEFHREWNGCWRVRTLLQGTVNARLEFTLLATPEGGLLALPRPLPAAWRTGLGVLASDGGRWTLDDAGALVRWEPRAPPPLSPNP